MKLTRMLGTIFFLCCGFKTMALDLLGVDIRVKNEFVFGAPIVDVPNVTSIADLRVKVSHAIHQPIGEINLTKSGGLLLEDGNAAHWDSISSGRKLVIASFKGA